MQHLKAPAGRVQVRQRLIANGNGASGRSHFHNHALIAGMFLGIVLSQIEPAQGGIVGDVVSVSRELALPYGPFIAGPYIFEAQSGSADTVSLSTGDNLYFNVEDTALLIQFGPSIGAGGPFPPLAHFLKFEDLSPTAPIITGVSNETNLDGFVAGNLLFTPHSATIGYGGIEWPGGQFLNVSLQLTAVPEPDTVGLLVIWASVEISRRRQMTKKTESRS